MTSTLSWIRDSIGYYLVSSTPVASSSTSMSSTPTGSEIKHDIPEPYVDVPLPVNPELVKEINALEIPDRSQIKFPSSTPVTQVVRHAFMIKELETARAKLKAVSKADLEIMKPLSPMQLMLLKIKEGMDARRTRIVGSNF